jgi:V8-like Glu-specific endopeptidase
MTTSVGDASPDQPTLDSGNPQPVAQAEVSSAAPVASLDVGTLTDGTTLSAAPTASYATNVYPYDCVCYMTMTFPGVGTFRGSAVIIGPHTILTAAHCLWDEDVQASATNIQLYPGDSSGSSGTAITGPYSIHYNAVDNLGGFLTNQQSQFDFGVIDVAEDLSSYGSFGIETNYAGGTVHMTGYPAIAGQAQTDQVGTVTADPTYSVLDYGTVAAHPGNSGGPMWVMNNGVAEVVGIVSTTGWGADITTADLAQIQSWEAADSGLWSVMKVETFRAVESVTGDIITGVVYDNAGRYSVGSTYTTGTDQRGGTWTYTVTGISTADSAHQNGSYSGMVYDLSYYDANLAATFSTYYGANGYSGGYDDKAYYSGSNYLGSEGDVVTEGSQNYSIGSGYYVIPDRPVMKLDTFTAVESVTGDVITGVLYDNTSRYSVGSTYTSATDQRGGTWTYTVNSIATADSAHQDTSYTGMVYDLSYRDAALATTYATYYGAGGYSLGLNDKTYYSGSNYLGSAGDVIIGDIGSYAIGGTYVLPKQMTVDTFTAVESVTGDVITGVLYDNTGRYSVGSSYTAATDQRGGTWTYTVTGIAAADSAHRNAAYSGMVYDLSYYSAGALATYDTYFGKAGYNSGASQASGATVSGPISYSGSNYLGSDGDVVFVNGTAHSIGSGTYVLPVPPVMKVETYTAVESVTGDIITGILYDNTGRYSVGSTYTSGTDLRGGTWTYTVNSIARADNAHQDGAYSGMVYDLSYYDADAFATYTTMFGATGHNGIAELANTSGSNYLGSDGDVVVVNGTSYSIGSGKYVVPVQTVMMVDTFTAVESTTGDTITGILYDNTSRYSVGSTSTSGTDLVGGTWTYTVNSIARADNAHQNASYSGMAYDLSYHDASAGATYVTVFGSQGHNGINDKSNYSGSNYLGSDGDVVTINGRGYVIASGKYVVPANVTAAATDALVTDTVDSPLGSGLLGYSDASGNSGAALAGGSDGFGANLGLLGNYMGAAFAAPAGGQADLGTGGQFVQDLTLAAHPGA